MVNAIVPIFYPVRNSTNNVLELRRVEEVLLNRDSSIHTLKALRSDMAYFYRWYVDWTDEDLILKNVSPREIMDFRDQMQKHLKPATVNRRLINVRLFFKTAVQLDIIQMNPALGVKQVASQGLAPKSLTAQEIRRFLKELDLHGTTRDLLVIHLMLTAGLRASEVISLTVQDIEITERKGIAVIRRAKGNKQRVVPLGSRLRSLISEYLDQYKPSDQLILGQRGPITQFALNKIVGKHAVKAGLKVHPHTLRHCYSFQYLLANPSDIVGLAQLLGHSSISTTQIYTQNRMEDLQERVEKLIF
jgi:integrase/recombinase XerD